MRKLFLFVFCIFLVLQLSACNKPLELDDGYTVVCTSFVVADWIENLLGDESGFNVKVLCDDGKDMHNFQPSAADMRDVISADLFVYIGGESDKWAEKVGRDKSAYSIRLLDVVEGICCLDDEENHVVHNHDTPDEHIWLSFENTLACVKVISDAVCKIDAENTEIYTELLSLYEVGVTSLYGEYQNAVANAEHKAVVFADRFPFVYLMDELGIEYAAAFPGCSSETSASFETVITLAKKVDEYGLPCVVVLEDSVDGIAETVINNTVNKNARIISLDSMQVYHANADFDYLETMSDNLSELKFALGSE